MTKDVPDPDPKTVLLFDGSCPLCRAEIGMYRKQDTAGALCFVDVSEPRAELPPTLDPKTAMARFHVVAGDGRMVSGAAAFIEVWRHLPGWRWAAKLASLPGIAPSLEVAYRLFLPMRPALARLLVASQRLRAAR